MLVLSRHTDEVICIGDNIRVMVVEIGDGRVRIGIEAPKDMSVNRLEVQQRMNKEQEATHDAHS